MPTSGREGELETARRTDTPSRPRQGLSGRDEELLRAIHTYAYLTAEQVCRLYYSPGSLEYVRRQLKRLVEDGYLQRLRLPTAGVGNPPFVYRMARRGYSSLAAAGIEIPHRFRPAEHVEHSAIFLAHTLAVNDVLIAGVRLEEEVAGVHLLEMRHEQTLKRLPMTVTLAATTTPRTTTLAPDGWLDYALPSGRMSVVLELDRGTEGREQLVQKLVAYIGSGQGAYHAYFGSDSMNVAIATTAGTQRAAHLVRWSEQTLTERGATNLADVFLVAAIPSGPLDARQTFLAPLWRQPFGQQMVALLLL